MNPMKRYLCPHCERLHHDITDAALCCVTPTTAYKCYECDTVYEDHDDAEKCCSPEQEEET